MKAEQAKRRTEQALEELTLALQSGHSEALTQVLRAMGLFHRYSWSNAMLIASQRPDATRVAGFRTWKKLGRHIMKGEKGLVIVAPIVRSKDAERADDESPVRGFRAAHVFDVSQTDGEPLAELARASGDPRGYTMQLRSFAEKRGIQVAYVTELGGADGRSLGGRIELREGLEEAEEFLVLAHELAHELLHHGGGVRGSRTVRETEAEAVAFAVAHGVGLEAGAAASDYIQLYRGDTDTLTASLQRIQSAASTILSGVTDVREEAA